MTTNAFGLPLFDGSYNAMNNAENFASNLGIDLPQIKPAGKIPFTEEHWNRFKEKLANTLRTKALDSNQIFEDTDAKNFIVNYMQNEIFSEESENRRLILNINIRLAHLTISTKDGDRPFPIILEYKVHHLIKVHYFTKNIENNQVSMETLDVKESPIVL